MSDSLSGSCADSKQCSTWWARAATAYRVSSFGGVLPPRRFRPYMSPVSYRERTLVFGVHTLVVRTLADRNQLAAGGDEFTDGV